MKDGHRVRLKCQSAGVGKKGAEGEIIGRHPDDVHIHIRYDEKFTHGSTTKHEWFAHPGDIIDLGMKPADMADTRDYLSTLASLSKELGTG